MKTTPRTWVEANRYGGFAVWQSSGSVRLADRQQIATFKLEAAALEYVAIGDWRAEKAEILKAMKRLVEWVDADCDPSTRSLVKPALAIQMHAARVILNKNGVWP